MASLDLDEIDDFLSSLDPENYSLRHAFMPMDQENEKRSLLEEENSQGKRKCKADQNEKAKRSDREAKSKQSEPESQADELIIPDRSPDSSGTDENSPPGRPIREQDRFLPLAIVSRLMKECIPSTAKVSRGARHLLQECVSEFIAFVTSEAIERCLADRRKTLTGEDLMAAMRTLGFDNYVQPMSLYLEKVQAQLRGEHTESSSIERPRIVKVEGNISLVPFSKSVSTSSAPSKKCIDKKKS